MKIRFTIYLLFFITAFSSLAVRAQPGKRQQIEQLKMDYITRRLDLSPSETKEFMPVYKNYQNDMNALMKDKRESRKGNTDADQTIDDELAFESQVLDLRKRYRNEFQKVISPDKIVLMFKAEREFRQQLIQELRQRRQ